MFFALELILADFQAESFGMVVLSSVTAAVIGRAAFGTHPFLGLPAFQLRSPAEYPLYVLLGLAAALVGVGFTRGLYGLEDLADRTWRAIHRPEWLRPAAGGLLLGGLLLVLPQLYGVGYPVLEHAIQGRYAAGFLLVLLAGKLLATSLTIAIGGSGGVFAPSLFMGAMLGTAYGLGVAHLLPHTAGPAGAYGLIGMGAVFAAAARAPLTGDTIYTLKLRRRGVDLARARGDSPLERLRVADAMQPLPDPLPADTPLPTVVRRLSDAPGDALPVVDATGALRGVVTAAEAEQALQDHGPLTAAELARATPALRDEQTLQRALTELVRHHDTGLPVVSAPDGHRVLGWLDHRDVLRALAATSDPDVGDSSAGRQPEPRTQEPRWRNIKTD